MAPHSFELSVTLPSDPRYADTARELAVHAARHAGCAEAQARAFGEEVVGALLVHVQHGRGDSVPLIVRRTSGPVEVLINGRSLSPQP